jgi:death-on-curing protein
VKRPEWILRETVLALHEQLLAEFGGSDGIRDAGLLDSALSRPENLFVEGQPTLSALASAYTFGLVKNHPFMDGNKRIGFAIGVIFLELNGRAFMAAEADAVVQTLALAAGEIGEMEYARWLEANCEG